ncbi:hypothetical protein BU17DRAFT_65246 [Hysterangium stoloniferum]|nr:hypothetical protein BU17DRAFT_65246 [Hysterangium stoloniferum]
MPVIRLAKAKKTKRINQGMLLQVRVSSSLADQIPEMWENELEAYIVVGARRGKGSPTTKDLPEGTDFLGGITIEREYGGRVALFPSLKLDRTGESAHPQTPITKPDAWHLIISVYSTGFNDYITQMEALTFPVVI